MERHGGKLWRQMYYFDEKINGYRKSKFPHEVKSAKMTNAKIVPEKPKPMQKRMPQRPQSRNATPPQRRMIQSPRRQMTQPVEEDPRVKYSRLARSGASMSLMDEYANLGRR